MTDREYAVWVFAPHLDTEPRITPAGSRHWAARQAEEARSEGVTAKAVFRYTFMPDMAWEDAA